MFHAPQTERTFFITSAAAQRKMLFRNTQLADLFLDTLQYHRSAGRFSLHAYVVMPDHVHLLLTPAEELSLEKAVQFVKGGFSYRAKREAGFTGEIWQAGFAEHRVKDAVDFRTHVDYIHMNPVRKRIVMEAATFPYSSASRRDVDPPPPHLRG